MRKSTWITIAVVLVVLVVLVALVAVRYWPRHERPAESTPPSATTEPVASEVPTLAPAVIPVPDPTATTAPTAKPAPQVVVGKCSLTDGTAQIQVTKVGNEWIVDPANLKVVAGYNNTAPGHDVSQLSGCNMLAEYEWNNPNEHHIDVLRTDATKPLAFLAADGKYHFPTPKGGSFWAIPANWNTCDLSTAKPAICLEFAANKQANQLRNGYDWPEVIKIPDGRIFTYEVGHVYGKFYSGCADIAVPSPVNVAGTILPDGKFNASIGMEGCLIAVKLDGLWTYWRDARDNVQYSDQSGVQAWLFPKSASEQDVKDWIAKQK